MIDAILLDMIAEWQLDFKISVHKMHIIASASSTVQLHLKFYFSHCGFHHRFPMELNAEMLFTELLGVFLPSASPQQPLNCDTGRHYA